VCILADVFDFAAKGIDYVVSICEDFAYEKLGSNELGEAACRYELPSPGWG